MSKERGEFYQRMPGSGDRTVRESYGGDKTVEDPSARPRRFAPELGQIGFGNPHGAYECPELLIAALRYLDEEIHRVENNAGRRYHSAVDNTGGEFANDTFSIRAYYWGEDEATGALPNFKCGDVEVRWYKWLGRGTSANRPVTPDEIADLFSRCLASVREGEP
jgi:hypothetical protein